MKFSMIFEGVDKASKVMKKIMATEKKAAAAVKGNSAKAARATAKTERSNSALNRSMNALKRSSGAAFRTVSRGAQKAGRAIKALHQKTLALAKNGFGSIKSGAGKIGRGVAVATGIMASIYGSAALAAGSMVDIGSQFENFQVQLTALEGSSAGAEKAMNWITNFATKTPLELDQVVESFASLRTFGLDPTNGTMQALVDTMAMSGKGADHLSGLTLALGQAWTKGKLQGEEALQLIERGVPVWDMLGQKYGKTAEQLQKMASKGQLGRDAIQDLITLMGERAAGASDKMSKTWTGMTSNMADHWQQFQTMIMNAGLFEWMKGKLRSILDVIDQMKADGTLQEWATKIGNSIQTALESAWTMATRIVEIGRQVGDFLGKAAEWAGGWDNLAIALGAIVFAPTLVATATGLIMIAKGVALLGAALVANPIGLAIAAIAGLAYLLVDDWGPVFDWFSQSWQYVSDFVSGIWSNIAGYAEQGMAGVKNAWSDAGAFFSNIWASITPEDGWLAAASNGWETIKASWAGATTFFSELWSGISSGFSTYLEPITSRLGAIGGKLQSVFDKIGQIGSKIAGLLPEGSGKTLNTVATALGKIAGFTFDVVLGGLELVITAIDNVLSLFTGDPIDWSSFFPDLSGWSLPTLDTSSLEAAWQKTKSLFTGWVPDFGDWSLPTLDTTALESAWQKAKSIFSAWTPDFASWSLPTLDISAITATWETIKSLFDWSPLEALDRTFGGIPGKIGGYLSEAAEMAGVAWNKLKSVFSDEAAVDIAARDPASIERATAAANKLQGALMNARSVDMSGVSSSISKLIAQASGLLDAVKQSVARAQAFLSGVSFHHHGVRMMDTLAAGMRARAQVVVDQIRATMQQVRNHLPSSPAKIGPLSDIHRLKFGETIAASIKADPMVRAMRTAAAATMMAATPIAVGANAMPNVTAQSALPVANSARSVTAAGEAASASGTTNSGQTIINYNPTINLSGDAKSAEGNFKKMLQEHKREIKRMVDDEVRRESRRKH